MDKKTDQSYKCLMRIPFIYSAAAATLFTVVAIDVGLQHVAVASHESAKPEGVQFKTEPSAQPTVIARFTKGDASFTPQPLEQTLHCVGDAYLSAVDLCAPLPVLTSKSAPSTLPTWKIVKMPVKFIWQQQVQKGRTLVVELNDSNGPVKSKSESFINGDRTSIVVTPGSDAPNRDIYLMANLYGADGKRLENWVLPIALKN